MWISECTYYCTWYDFFWCPFSLFNKNATMKKKLQLLFLFTLIVGNYAIAQIPNRTNAKFQDFEILKIVDPTFPNGDTNVFAKQINTIDDQLLLEWVKKNKTLVSKAILSTSNKFTRNDYLKLSGRNQAHFTHKYSTYFRKQKLITEFIQAFHYNLKADQTKTERKTIILVSERAFNLLTSINK